MLYFMGFSKNLDAILRFNLIAWKPWKYLIPMYKSVEGLRMLQRFYLVVYLRNHARQGFSFFFPNHKSLLYCFSFFHLLLKILKSNDLISKNSFELIVFNQGGFYHHLLNYLWDLYSVVFFLLALEIDRFHKFFQKDWFL